MIQKTISGYLNIFRDNVDEKKCGKEKLGFYLDEVKNFKLYGKLANNSTELNQYDLLFRFTHDKCTKCEFEFSISEPEKAGTWANRKSRDLGKPRTPNTNYRIGIHSKTLVTFESLVKCGFSRSENTLQKRMNNEQRREGECS